VRLSYFSVCTDRQTDRQRQSTTHAARIVTSQTWRRRDGGCRGGRKLHTLSAPCKTLQGGELLWFVQIWFDSTYVGRATGKTRVSTCYYRYYVEWSLAPVHSATVGAILTAGSADPRVVTPFSDLPLATPCDSLRCSLAFHTTGSRRPNINLRMRGERRQQRGKARYRLLSIRSMYIRMTEQLSSAQTEQSTHTRDLCM